MPIFYKFLPVATALIVYGIGFIIVEKRNKNKTPRWSNLNDLTFQGDSDWGFPVLVFDTRDFTLRRLRSLEQS